MVMCAQVKFTDEDFESESYSFVVVKFEMIIFVKKLTIFTPGKLKTRPRIGTLLIKLTATGKNPL